VRPGGAGGSGRRQVVEQPRVQHQPFRGTLQEKFHLCTPFLGIARLQS
jgi:hypothetical protein